MFKTNKILLDGLSVVYPLASFVSQELYLVLKALHENLKQTDVQSKIVETNVRVVGIVLLTKTEQLGAPSEILYDNDYDG